LFEIFAAKFNGENSEELRLDIFSQKILPKCFKFSKRS